MQEVFLLDLQEQLTKLTSGQVLISNGNTSPTWGSATSVSEDNYWKIDDGLNYHLAFKEGSGTTVADLGGGRNNFTGTATWTETMVLIWLCS